MHNNTLNRRSFLAGMGGASILGAVPPLAWASGGGQRYLVLVILRGALDGLAAVTPYHEKQLRDWRRELLAPEPGREGGALALGIDGFALHPSLSFMHQAWRDKEALVLHAASSPYRERSHFDGQDVLESGASRVFGADSGWLNRALGVRPPSNDAAAVGPTLPLVLRGEAQAVSWSPSTLPEAQEDTLERLLALYENDQALHQALTRARELDESAGGMGGGRQRGRSYEPIMQAAGQLISSGSAGVVVLSLDGWDTHNRQGNGSGALAQRLQQLDSGLASLKTILAERWNDTAILLSTEFGRTVRANGTGGTDHGTGGAAFLLGGAVAGGQMPGDWPGLDRKALYQDRDLYPANSLHALFKGVLRDHLGVARSDLDAKVFPDSRDQAPLDGLIRT